MNKVIGQLKNYGFQRPVIGIEDHIFGATNYGTVLNPTGQYDKKPQYEPQAENFETQGCTVWGTENAIEFLHIFKFLFEKNYEELPPYIGAGIDPNSGGNPHTVAEWIRKNGLVEAPNAPFPKSLGLLLGKTLAPNIVNLGKDWINQYNFRHQWVLQGYEGKEQRMVAIKEALKYGVLGISVTAWFEQNGIYVDNGLPNTHWCVCYGWTDKGWKVFDSYDHSEKIYSFDARLDFAKLYHLEKKDLVAQTSWLLDMYQRILSALKDLLTIDKALLEIAKPVEVPDIVPPEPTPQERLRDICISSVGKDISPDDKAPDEKACAESLSNLLKLLYPNFPVLVSTVELYKALKNDTRFTGTLDFKPWTLIITPTQGGNGRVSNGHVGIVGEHGVIYSNNSGTGKWDNHWTVDEWVSYYKIKGGYRIHLFNV